MKPGQLFKKRKGFSVITIEGENFQYKWVSKPSGPCLILYSADGVKMMFSHLLWVSVPNSPEYDKKDPVHHGNHGKGANFAAWGKPEAAEMYRKSKVK